MLRKIYGFLSVAGLVVLSLCMTQGAALRESKPGAMQVALTFDDGPDPIYTPILLDQLKKCQVHATFFLMGKSIPGNEDIIRQMDEEGHLIGNHTYNHVQLSKINETEACREIYETNNLIYEITGKYPEYLRPPFGEWNEGLDLKVTMMPVLWDVDPVDWNTSREDLIVNRVICAVEDGDIILLHDQYKSSVAAAVKIIKILEQQGYEFVTVDQLLVVN